MKKLYRMILSACTLALGGTAWAQTPANSEAVMLQAFYYNSYNLDAAKEYHSSFKDLVATWGTTRWTNLTSQATEINEYFDLVWLPPSGNADGTGYYPKSWSSQSGSWGNKSELKSLITALHNGNTKVIADMVLNHRQSSSGWCAFSTDNFGDTYGSYTFTKAHICRGDEANTNPSSGNACYQKITGAEDTGENEGGCRDLDHTNQYVQNACTAYMKWMKNEIGYDGWRFDFVKGFGASYVGKYITSAAGVFAVAEMWDGSWDALTAYVNGTGKKTTVFDFHSKYSVLRDGLASGNYSKMVYNGKPGGLCSDDTYKQYSVNFVDNHDTFRDKDNDPKNNRFNGKWEQAYAFILSAPGVPCVFWPHWVSCKANIKAMIKARKACGITNTSSATASATSTYYTSTTTGSKGKLICYIGSGWSEPGSGYTLVAGSKSDNWAYYTNVPVPVGPTVTMTPKSGYATSVTLTGSTGSKVYYTTDGTTPSSQSTLYTNPISVTSANFTIKAIAIDGTKSSEVVSGTFTNVQPQGLTVSFKKPTGWSATINLYAWTESGPILGEWPGRAITASGDTYSYTITETTERPISIIFNDGTNQTSDLSASESQNCWDASKMSSCDKCTPPACGIPPIGSSMYVRVKASTAPSAPSIYAWQGETHITAEWPGTAMSKNGDWYDFTNSTTDSYNVVFNDGKASGGSQTADITGLSGTVCFELSTGGDKGWIATQVTCPTTSVEEMTAQGIILSPNPTTGKVSVSAEVEIQDIQVVTTNGVLVLSTTENEFDMSVAQAGVYYVRILLSNGESVIKKLIKR